MQASFTQFSIRWCATTYFLPFLLPFLHPFFLFLLHSYDRLASIVFLFGRWLPNIDDAARRLPLSRLFAAVRPLYFSSSQRQVLVFFLFGLSEISLSCVALPDRSSQANPVLLGFSLAESVRESVLLCALSGLTTQSLTPNNQLDCYHSRST